MRIEISDLAPLHIRNVVFEALRHGDAFRADLVDHLMDLIDWRHTHHADRETVAMLRLLRDASDRYEHGELSLDGYRDLSVSLFFPVHTRRSPRRTDGEQRADHGLREASAADITAPRTTSCSS